MTETQKPYEVLVAENRLLRERLQELESQDRRRPEHLLSNVSKLIVKKNEDLEKANRELQEAFERTVHYYINTLLSLCRLVESKTPWYRDHSTRVGRMARLIGREMGLDGKRQDLIEKAGYLHDFGYIGVDPNLRVKQGELTEAEWKEIRSHVRIAEMMMEPIGPIEIFREWILTHHERWDGSGYPNGLKGEEIPLEGRILAVADSYDSIVSGRPYREPRSEEEAVEEMRKNVGSQFDPAVVEAFVQIKDGKTEERGE